jgi:hypothetical protein
MRAIQYLENVFCHCCLSFIFLKEECESIAAKSFFPWKEKNTIIFTHAYRVAAVPVHHQLITWFCGLIRQYLSMKSILAKPLCWKLIQSSRPFRSQNVKEPIIQKTIFCEWFVYARASAIDDSMGNTTAKSAISNCEWFVYARASAIDDSMSNTTAKSAISTDWKRFSSATSIEPTSISTGCGT